MNKAIGKKIWAIAEGYIPKESTGLRSEMASHETICVLNTSDQEAEINLTIYFDGQDPAGPYKFSVPPKRTKHVKVNDLNEPEVIPKGVEYSIVVESNIPVVCQHTRLDSRQAENALLSTIAYSE